MDMQMVDTAHKYFNGGRVHSQREYCRKYISKVYEMLESMFKNNTKEMFIPHRYLSDSCYSASEILYIVTGELNSKNKEQQLVVGKKHWIKGWSITLK